VFWLCARPGKLKTHYDDKELKHELIAHWTLRYPGIP
jgi:hypothetical protein